MSDQQAQWSAVDQFITDHLVEADEALDGALSRSKAAGLPNISVAPNQGKLLMQLARMQKAKNILEIGTLGGYSTIWLGRALPKDGKIITLEYEPKHAEVAKTNIAKAGLSDKVEVIVGKAIDILPTLVKRAPFDLIFIDADKPSNPDYFEWAMKLARPGTLIICDNVVRTGAIVDMNNKDASITGTRKLYEILSKDKRVTATAIQTVGSKGYDGFATVLVN